MKKRLISLCALLIIATVFTSCSQFGDYSKPSECRAPWEFFSHTQFPSVVILVNTCNGEVREVQVQSIHNFIKKMMEHRLKKPAVKKQKA